MTELDLIRELDRLRLNAEASNDPDDWISYWIARRTVDALLARTEIAA